MSVRLSFFVGLYLALSATAFGQWASPVAPAWSTNGLVTGTNADLPPVSAPGVILSNTSLTSLASISKVNALPGATLRVLNTTTNNVTIVHSYGSPPSTSSAILTPLNVDLVLVNGGTLGFVYDGSSWRAATTDDQAIPSTADPGQTTVNGGLTDTSSSKRTLTTNTCITYTDNGDGTVSTPLSGLCQEVNTQGYLSLVSSSLKLCPYNGSAIYVGGVRMTIPSSCVSLAATGLTVSTLYYVYAYSNSGTLTLEASTTTHATDATTGTEIKSGDSTRSLVGMAYIITGPAFADTASQRYVASWFNRQTKKCGTIFSANRSTTSTTYAEPTSGSEIECSFVVWGAPAGSSSNSDSVVWRASGALSNGTASDGCGVSVGFDSTTSAETEQNGFVGTSTFPFSIEGSKQALAEGQHYITLLIKIITGGTCTVNNNYSSLQASVLQ